MQVALHYLIAPQDVHMSFATVVDIFWVPIRESEQIEKALGFVHALWQEHLASIIRNHTA
jgi:hypothetical protein